MVNLVSSPFFVCEAPKSCRQRPIFVVMNQVFFEGQLLVQPFCCFFLKCNILYYKLNITYCHIDMSTWFKILYLVSRQRRSTWRRPLEALEASMEALALSRARGSNGSGNCSEVEVDAMGFMWDSVGGLWWFMRDLWKIYEGFMGLLRVIIIVMVYQISCGWMQGGAPCLAV